ncbi:hypothetical protein BJ165DRAFT_1479784 [Panaeolus papilionaceus]|nr:hypothetical protein BJ165DRAFT_1479784 [Panaeolus papilionaceus]
MAFIMTHPLSADAASKMVEELKRIQVCVDTQKYGTIAALLIVLLDHGDSFSQEIKRIWRYVRFHGDPYVTMLRDCLYCCSAPFSATKVIFMMTRYFGLFVQMSNLAASMLLTTNNNTRNGTCSHWHISLLGAAILIYMLSSISLSMTVHQLLNHSTRSRNILVGLHLFQFAFGCLCGYFLLVNKIYTPNCDSHNVAFALSLFGFV